MSRARLSTSFAGHKRRRGMKDLPEVAENSQPAPDLLRPTSLIHNNASSLPRRLLMFSFKRSLIALVGLLIVVGTLATLMPLVSRGQGNNPIVAQLQPRKFYLTKTEDYTGSQALSACASGYHMASLWEIFDTSNLRYDTALGASSTDSGSGPPVAVYFGLGHFEGDGWIRTGGEV